MYEVRMTKTFRKDTERCKKRGFDMQLLKTAIRLLEANGQLPKSYRPHKLSGDYGGCWECHLKGDWLLIWEQNYTELTLWEVKRSTSRFYSKETSSCVDMPPPFFPHFALKGYG